MAIECLDLNKKSQTKDSIIEILKAFQYKISIEDNAKKGICKLVFNDSKMQMFIDNNEYALKYIDDVLKHKNELTNRMLTLS